jgi:DNA-directed RNA polymerase specialized sigma24 family protein
MITLESLYIAHRRELVAHAVLCGCDHHSAEDVVQDMFINLYRYDGAAKIDGAKNPVGWLKQKLRWMVIKAFEHANRACRGGGAVHLDVDQAYDVSDSAETPDLALHRKDTRAVLTACGCTEETVIWQPELTRAKTVALYRFRQSVKPKIAKLLC